MSLPGMAHCPAVAPTLLGVFCVPPSAGWAGSFSCGVHGSALIPELNLLSFP